ncbi:MAG: hypothetical protein NVSMB5_06840 [Candidatus Velthaea sp.]
MEVRTRQAGALSAYFTSTLAFAIIAHVIVESLSTGSLRTLTTPIHAALAGAALVALATLAVQVGALAHGAERRRRSALFLASLPRRGRNTGFLIASVGAQAGIGFGALALEGLPHDPARLAMAAFCALAALWFGACVSRALGGRVLALIVPLRPLAAPVPPRPRSPWGEWATIVTLPGLYELFLPKRPPPNGSSGRPFFNPFFRGPSTCIGFDAFSRRGLSPS